MQSNQQQIIEQTKFTYSPLGEVFDKQIKTIEDQGKKQVDALEKLTPKEEIKPIEATPNNHSKARIIFNLEKSLNEIRQIIYSLHQSKEISKKVYNNLTKSL